MDGSRPFCDSSRMERASCREDTPPWAMSPNRASSAVDSRVESLHIGLYEIGSDAQISYQW